MNEVSAYQHEEYEKDGNELAPIALFVYNRPEHTLKTLKAIKNNTLASESVLYIFSDGFKESTDDFDKKKILETRAIITSDQWCKIVKVFEFAKNKGLAASIIDGVSQVLQGHDKIIVLEDDIVTSRYFLQYMNDALNLYQNQEKVWHISGYSYPYRKKGLAETFFTRLMVCWGWGTWKNRWEYFQKNTDELLMLFNKTMKYSFNYGKGNQSFGQIERNKAGIINTWAVYWYATIFTHNGFCLNPRESLVQNIGMDGSGIHCGNTSFYNVRVSNKYPVKFELNIKESSKTRKRIQEYFRTQELKIIVNNMIKRFIREGVIEATKYYTIKYISNKKTTSIFKIW
jgi:GT2 family glycosyltransferase